MPGIFLPKPWVEYEITEKSIITSRWISSGWNFNPSVQSSGKPYQTDGNRGIEPGTCQLQGLIPCCRPLPLICAERDAMGSDEYHPISKTGSNLTDCQTQVAQAILWLMPLIQCKSWDYKKNTTVLETGSRLSWGLTVTAISTLSKWAHTYNECQSVLILGIIRQQFAIKMRV